MKYLVDTDWVAEYLKGRQPAVSTLASLVEDGLAISLITYGEIYEGIYFGRNPAQSEKTFNQFLRMVEVIGPNRAIMRLFAQVRGNLRQAGQSIGDMDILIACSAIHHDLTLITHNTKHFERISNLKLFRTSRL